MILVSPLYWALEPECEILLFMWSFGPLCHVVKGGCVQGGKHWGTLGSLGEDSGVLGLTRLPTLLGLPP